MRRALVAWILVIVLAGMVLEGCRTESPRAVRATGDVRGARALSPDRYQQVTETRWPDSEPIGRHIRAIGPDGSMVIDESRGGVQGREEDRHWLSVRGTLTPISSPAHRARQQWTSAVLTPRWLVWRETTSFGLDTDPWTLYSLDRTSGEIRQLARAPQVSGMDPPPVPGYTGQVVLGDQVYWAQVNGKRGAERVDIVGCRIDQCRPRRVLADAAFPAGSGHDLWAVRVAPTSTSAEERTMQLIRVDGRTGRLRHSIGIDLARGMAPSGLASDDAHVVMTFRREQGDRAVILEVASGTRKTFTTGVDGMFGRPVVGEGFVAWSETSGSGMSASGGYLVDLNSGRVFGIGDSTAHAVQAAGRYLSWMQKEGPEEAWVSVDRVVRMKP